MPTPRRDSVHRRALRVERLESRRLLAADVGDAPIGGYASHEAIGPRLGALRDAESSVTVTTGAAADGADDDGVFYGVLRVGQTDAVITVNVQNAPAGAKLDAWWDFNRDNAWSAEEQIADALPVVEGDNAVTFDIPATASDGLAYARFRLSTAGDLAVSGMALDGEVEDYYIPIAHEDDDTFGGQQFVDLTNRYAITAADMDGDGDDDLITAGFSIVEWHENVGGAFAAPQRIGTFTLASVVAAGDIDGDGDVDVLAGVSNDFLVLFRNDGRQVFTGQTGPASGGVMDLADFDGDGDLDVFSAGSEGVVVYLTQGANSWTPRILAADMGVATAVVARDLDGDGDVDVLAGDYGDDLIVWFENDGSTGLTRHTISTSAVNIRTATPADVDGDGDFDVVAGLWTSGDLVWYENDDEGEFAMHLVAAGGGLGPRQLGAADVDGDGDVDLLASTDTQLRWHENDGTGEFASHAIATGAESNSALLIDVDGDGRLDVVTMRGSVVPQVTWQRQLAAMDFGDAPMPYHSHVQHNGARHNAVGPRLGALRDAEMDGVHDDSEAEDDGVTFGPLQVGGWGVVTVNVQNAPAGARLDAWIDFDGDGSWGVAGERIAASQAVVEGDNVLTFSVPSWAAAGSTFARFRLSTAGGHGVDGAALDGEVEDYAVTIASPGVATGAFGGAQTIAAGSPSFMVTADVDGDGDMDVVTKSALLGPGTFTWHENQGSNVFVPHTLAGLGAASEDFAVGDLDSDGDLDFVGFHPGELVWMENDGQQNFTRRTASVGTALSSITSLAIPDMDGDGDNDVLAANLLGQPWVYLLVNDGAETFTPRLIGAFQTSATSVVAVDLDRDGDVDVVSGGRGSSAIGDVAWLQNDGSLKFTERTIKPTPREYGATESVAVGDLDGDGDLDVVAAGRPALVGSPPRASLSWHEQVADGAFVQHDLEFTRDLRWATLADMDGDGDLDILTGGYSNSIDLYVNRGNSTFVRRQVSTSLSSGWSVATADMDGDGDLDVVGVNVATGIGVAWFENLDYDEPDYGDAPASYGTLRENGGAVHNSAGPRLGALRDDEADGIPGAAADGDGSDDDGVTFGPLRPGNADATITINVQNAPGGARVDAWIDFNGDGMWAGADEHLVADAAVTEGDNVFMFTVPSTAAGTTYARVRLSTAGHTTPTGFAVDGEVEDYAVVIDPPGETTGEYAAFRPAFDSIDYVIRTADIDGDGDMDVVSDSYTGGIVWHENLNDGAFLRHPLQGPSIGIVWDLHVVDFDHDGDADLVANATGSAYWFENNGKQSFRRRTIGSTDGSQGSTIDVVDADGDGDWDVLAAGNLGIRWLINNGQQQFTTRMVEPRTVARRARAADMDGDGDLDIVASATFWLWLENRGGSYVSHSQSPSQTDDFVLADLDRDGDLDVIARSSGVTWHENVGGAAFVAHMLPVSIGPSSVTDQGLLAVVDADGDGDFDIVLPGGGQPRMFVNDGAHNFTLVAVGPVPGFPGAPAVSSTSVAVADLNGDGRLEIIVGAGFSTQSGYYEPLPPGDYDRNGSVDEADRVLYEQTLGQAATPPGSGADGDGDGQIDEDDLAVWQQHVGQALIPRVLAANSDPFVSEIIDGRDFLAWQRRVGATGGSTFNVDWDGNFVVDGGDLEVWKRQFGRGIVPDTAWIFSSPGTAAAATALNESTAGSAVESPDVASPARSEATSAAIAGTAPATNVFLSVDATPTRLSRPTYAPRVRDNFSAAIDAVLSAPSDEPLRPVSPAWAKLSSSADSKPEDVLATTLADEAFGRL